eukprot:TRINITY_DN1137_c0_g1_i2.p1 TRINITY_DN1137_c0_g1~~TRINITY_DN1137_c0_g1_i2.p1  ORF type:complete len:245 (+),score=42.48 TRINITY_DN1137_c0_g1_i2:37-771(+)
MSKRPHPEDINSGRNVRQKLDSSDNYPVYSEDDTFSSTSGNVSTESATVPVSYVDPYWGTYSAYYYPSMGTTTTSSGTYSQSADSYPIDSYSSSYSNYGSENAYSESIVTLDGKKVKAPPVEKRTRPLRSAAGEVWIDDTLTKWPKDDYRIFVGNLGNDVNDQKLLEAFSHYKSAKMAHVVRDKRTTKTKGYGFVSFLDAKDFIKALREMNGKYICNRPCKLTKSRWKERTFDANNNNQEKKKK